jgi:hypothetical protein
MSDGAGDIDGRLTELYMEREELFGRVWKLHGEARRRPIRRLLLELAGAAEDYWLEGTGLRLKRACDIIEEVEEIARRLRMRDIADLMREIRERMEEEMRLLGGSCEEGFPWQPWKRGRS